MTDNNHKDTASASSAFISYHLFGFAFLMLGSVFLRQHVKSCASEKLVYTQFWNLKGAVGTKTPQNKWYLNVCYICSCTNYLYPEESQCFTVLYVAYGETFSVHSTDSCWEAAAAPKFPTQAEFRPLRHTPKGKTLLLCPYAYTFNKLCVFDPKSQEREHPVRIYSW